MANVIKKQHKYDIEIRLTPQECISLGIGEEVKCTTCGKLIPFGISMSRHTYKFKRQKNGKMRYYCKYSSQVEDEKKDPPDPPDKRRKRNKN